MRPVAAVLGEPMGAPEDRPLKSLRFAILLACSVILGVMLAYSQLRAAFGVAPAIAVLLGLLTLLALVPFYVRLKNERDAEHLDVLLAASRAKYGEDQC